MGENAPFWIGIIGTLIALAVFANGWRIRNQGRTGASLGCAHMLLAVLFIPMIWWIILTLLPG